MNYSPHSKELQCNVGPYVYQQWLGKGFRKPWEEVKRCIPTKCKSTNETSYIKHTAGPGGKALAKNIINHINCAPNWVF